jgi:SAM-dependent methyltransferase
MTISTEGPKNFFGELYLRSTRPFLAGTVSDAEADFLEARLREGDVSGLVLDLGCGHGRHLSRLAQRLPGRLIGIDADQLSLDEAKTSTAVARGDFFRLPFRDDSFGAAYCWYNTLGTFADEAVPVALSELTRCVRRRGWFVVHGTPPHSVTSQPEARYDAILPDGSRLIETVRYEPATSRDVVKRELHLPDGRFMAASFFIRYYGVSEWEALLDAAGFSVRWVHGGADGSSLTEASVDQMVGAQKRG